MAKKTTAKPSVKAKAKKPAQKPAAKKPVKKAAPASKASKPKPAAAPAAKKAKPAPAKPKAAPPKPAPAKTPVKEAKKAPVQPAKSAEKKPAGKTSITKQDSSKANSMSSTVGTKSSGKTSTPAPPVKANKPKPRSSDRTEPGRNFTPYEVKKGEVYMNEQQRGHFKGILLHWRDELMQEVDRTVHHMQDEAANPPDPADRATLEEEFSIELRTRDRERRLIKKIDSTIELIANDDYGYCDSCGVEIGIRRLEARPTANKCIDCKTLDEIKEKQLGSA